MKPIPRRKFRHALDQACRSEGLELQVEAKRGSHEGWIVRDPRTGESLKFTITSHTEISAGVLWKIQHYTKDMARHVAIAVVLHEILKRICGN